MPNIAISVALTTELNDVVQKAVATGDYATSSEVVREALREWKARRAERELGHAELRQLWTEGIDSGPGRLHSMDAIKREARLRR